MTEQFGKAFNEHLDAQTGREVSVVLNVAGKDLTFYQPTGGQIMALSMLAADTGNLLAMARDVSQLIMGLLDEDGQDHFRAALMHWSEPLPPDALARLVHRLTEEWTARPTEPQPESSPSAPSGGNSSTANSRRAGTRATSSRSPRSASAT